MDFEDIEEEYKKNIKSVENKFLDSKQNSRESERDYKANIRDAREKYNSRMKEFFRKVQKKPKKKYEKENSKKIYKADPAVRGLSDFDKIKIRGKVSIFKFKLNLINFINRFYYSGPAYYSKRIKLIWKREFYVFKISLRVTLKRLFSSFKKFYFVAIYPLMIIIKPLRFLLVKIRRKLGKTQEKMGSK
ncbi:MAG: hypothetical protein AABW89_04335 [Nanoarchaeota archaeon]